MTLRKTAHPNLSYAGLNEILNERSSLPQIRDAVISIRASKLPDPKTIGNAGSFFKNPTVNGVKQSAAALIEQAGLKGFTLGAAQVSPMHALVITNTGSAKAIEVFALAKHVRRQVYAKTGIELLPEPIFLGFSNAELETFYDLT
jgi:UDP-N-acetylmuramate dehydrogenase